MFEFGISKQRLLEGDPEDSDDWQVGHPILFPNILAVGDHRVPEFQIRVPMDDTHTYVVWYWTRPTAPGAGPQNPHDITVTENPFRHENGRLVVETINGQDMMAWVTQGDISDRTTERLGTSDQGIILYRNMLEENMRKVERGEDPMAVFRDPAQKRADDRRAAREGGLLYGRQLHRQHAATRCPLSSAASSGTLEDWQLVRFSSSAGQGSSGVGSPKRSCAAATTSPCSRVASARLMLSGALSCWPPTATTQPALRGVLGTRAFDVVVDNIAYLGEDVTTLLDVLDGRVGHYVVTSSSAVYANRYVRRPLREHEADLYAQVAGRSAQSLSLAARPGVRQRQARRRAGGAGRLALHWTILRPPVVLGADDRTLRVWWFVQRLLDGEPLLVPEWGAGRLFQLAWTHDIARAAVSVAGNSAAFGRAYNVAQAEVYTAESWIETAAAILGVSARYARFARG